MDQQPRRAHSGLSRPRTERAPTSSSTGSRTREYRHEEAPDRSTRKHRDSTTWLRSTKSHRESRPSKSKFPDSQPSAEFSDEPEEWERGTTVQGGTKRRKKKDEPMSPIAVVCYVVFFYVIWQILTRSDETEILSHVPIAHLKSLSSNLHSDLRSQSQSQYHLPYHLPQIPSPMPNTAGESPSTSRTVFGVIMYPFYILITIIATSFPLLVYVLHILFDIIVAILYPITATLRLFGRTFILAPFSVISNAVAVFYPLYVFIAGVIGVGCVLGLGVGWVGKLFLDIVFGRKRPSTGRRRSVHDSRQYPIGSRSSMPGPTTQANRRKAFTPSSGEEREHLHTPKNTYRPLEDEDEEDEDDVQYVSQRYAGSRVKTRSGTWDPHVVGLRKRGVR
jgi:hypothetical protein